MEKRLFYLGIFMAIMILFTSLNSASAATFNLVPVMTGAVTPSGQVIASSTHISGDYLPWKAFDHKNALTTDAWVTADNVTSGMLQYQFQSKQIVTQYAITSQVDNVVAGNSAPKAWTLEGSNDGVTYYTISTVSDESNWTSGERRLFTVDQSRLYLFYRMNVIENNGFQRLAIGELEFMGNNPIHLSAIGRNSEVVLTWKATPGANSYVVRRATEENGTYTTLAEYLTEVTFTDPTVTNGTTYYYRVSAINEDGESAIYSQVFAIPYETAALLKVTLTSGAIKEFDLDMSEVFEFIEWYEIRAAGSGPAAFAFNKDSDSKGPFLERKSFIAFNSIYSFDVHEYIVE